MEYLALTRQDLFYTVGVVFMATVIAMIVGMVIAAVVIKRKVDKKIKNMKAVPRRGMVYVSTFLKALTQ